MLRKATLAGALTLALLTSGCLGPNNAQNRLRNWNANLSSQDWVCEITFIGMTVVPVYLVAYVADILVLNTIDYWAEDNLVEEAGPFPYGFGKGNEEPETMASGTTETKGQIK